MIIVQSVTSDWIVTLSVTFVQILLNILCGAVSQFFVANQSQSTLNSDHQIAVFDQPSSRKNSSLFNITIPTYISFFGFEVLWLLNLPFYPELAQLLT